MFRKDISEVLDRLQIEKDEEGYYKDAYGNRISFNGIRTLKPAFTKLKLTQEHIEEIVKCAKDYQYFRANYCIILTKKGYDRPEPRAYQERLENDLLENKRNIVLFGRQSGKCSHGDTFINIKNETLGIPETKMTIETFHNIEYVMKFSKNKAKLPRYRVTIDSLFKTKPFSKISKNDISEEQMFRLEECINIINSFSLRYKGSWISGFLENNLEDNYVLRICNILSYIEKNKVFDNQEYFTLLYGPEKGELKYNEKCDRIKGEKNPGYKHGGLLSPFSPKSLVHSEETRLNVKLKIKEIKKDPARRGHNTKEYWLSKGFNEENAIKKVSEVQCTFSYKKCIERYGETRGKEIFDERQEKWQKTLNDKSPEELKDINLKKGKGINAGYTLIKIRRIGIENSANIPCKLYYIRFYNENIEFWKIGITISDIDSRFGNEDLFKHKYNLKRDIIHIEKTNMLDAFIKEQTILKTNKDSRIKVDYNNFKSSECFDKNINLEIDTEIYEYIKAKI